MVNGPEDYRWLRERLPGRFLAAVGEESDALALEGYLPAALEGRSAEAAAAEERLGLQLADPEFWTAMSVVSCKLYGVPLSENGRAWVTC